MDIVEELRKDRENGAKRLVSEYKAGLMSLARRFYKNESDAEELVNATFAKVVANIDDYLEQSAFFAWMCQILTNEFRDSVKRKSNKVEVYPGTLPDIADEGAQEKIFCNLDHSLLRDAIETLPREMKEAIMLHYIAEQPVPVVARFLRLPISTVKWRLHVARKELARRLGAGVKDAVRKPSVKAILLALALCGLTALGAAAWNLVVSGESRVASRVSSSASAEASQHATCDTRQAEASNLSTFQPFNFSTDNSQGENMNISKTHTRAAILAAATVATSAIGAEVRFTDSLGDHDLANAANWSSSPWGAGDTLVISTNSATIPTTGLHLSADMPASGTIKFGAFPNENVMVDFGGHSLNTTNLVFSNMHDDNNRSKHLLASGGFSGVKNLLLNEDHRGHVRFTNGTFRVKNSLIMGKWYPYVHVLAEAELVIENVIADNSVGMNGALSGEFRVSGGKFVVRDREINPWRRSYWDSFTSNRSSFTVEKGGEYRDDSRCPENCYLGGTDFTIRDAGYYETNSAFIVRNTRFTQSGGDLEITNSVFRVAQLYLGKYQISDAYGNELDGNLSNRTVDFCDSEETFAFAPNSGKTAAGVILPPTAKNNTIKFRGEKNRFTSQTFVLGGSNTVAVTGGKFDVSNSFSFVTAQAGSGSRLIMKDVDAYLGSLSVAADATDALVEIAGDASVEVASLALSGETTFKFAISGDGFAAAPLRFGSAPASGNAKFDFDMTDFNWPRRRTDIPLVRDDGGFASWDTGGTALNVASLNAAHPGILPADAKGDACSFKLGADGKTLCLSVPGAEKGLVISFK